jgi:hypothetical protein
MFGMTLWTGDRPDAKLLLTENNTTQHRKTHQFGHLVLLLRPVMSPTLGLYVHRTTQNRRNRRKIHVWSEIRIQYPTVRGVKTHTLDCVATVIGAFGNKTIWKA